MLPDAPLGYLTAYDADKPRPDKADRAVAALPPAGRSWRRALRL